MTNNTWGLTKLALLNTAGYAKCVIPLNDSASICAPNNTGKSSVINALQFPLINDLRLTEWDGHEIDETRKFYFATDQSYILLEADLPHGKVVIGVAGLGKIAGYAHQYFCYNGELDLSHYTKGQSIVKYGKLFNHLQAMDIKPFELKSSELNALLTGGATPFDSDISLKMIPLNNASDASVYKEIFRKILSLHKLGSNDVKRFMLRVFERHMSNANVDFFDVWNSAFERVNRDRKELHAIVQQQESIAELESLLHNQSVLKGKIAVYSPKIDKALVEFEEYQQEKTNELNAQIEALTSERSLHDEKQQMYMQQLRDVERRNLQLDQWFNEYDALNQQYQLTSESNLQAQLAAVKNKYDQLSSSISGAQGQNLTTIQLRIKDTKQQLKRLKMQLANLEYNVYSRLREDLSASEVDALSKLLSPELLSLSTTRDGDVTIHEEHTFSDFIEAISNLIKTDHAELPGATISLKKLHAVSMPGAENKIQLKDQITALESTLLDLEKMEQVAHDLEGKLAEKESFYQNVIELEADIKRFQRFATMQDMLDEQQAMQAQLEEEDHELQQKLSDIQAAVSTLADRRNLLAAQQEKLARQYQRLSQIKNERIDHELDVVTGNVVPYPIEVVIDFDSLEDTLHYFNKDCQELRNFNVNIRNTYLHIYKSGITRFESENNEFEKYDRLIAVYHNIDNEKEAIERQARVALTTVAATIKGLREDLHRLKREMYNFNRGIWRQQISNLKEFKIEVVERKTLIDHIDLIISMSENYEQGDNLDLLAAGTPTDNKQLDEAKDYIIQFAADKGGLKLADLFDVRFKVVNRNDDTEYFNKIDSAGSNGTRITIKLLCGMLFIRHLLTDKDRSAFRIPIYIDEAADIDPQNQQAIIETATGFGFIPIFASVKPQTSCRYIVPIRTIKEGTQNWVDEKDWIEVMETPHDDEAQEAESA